MLKELLDELTAIYDNYIDMCREFLNDENYTTKCESIWNSYYLPERAKVCEKIADILEMH